LDYTLAASAATGGFALEVILTHQIISTKSTKQTIAKQPLLIMFQKCD
jgi:hypothetical protein